MAAYAALNSVMNILQQIQHHPHPPITIQDQHMDSLSEIITFLQDFLENYSQRDMGRGKEALETRIADAAYAAEDVIESHIVDQILAGSSNTDGEIKSSNNRFSYLRKAKSNFHHFRRGFKKMIRTLEGSHSHKTDHQNPSGDQERSSNSLFCQKLQKVTEDMNSIKKEVIKIQEKNRRINDDQLQRNIISMSANIIGSSVAPLPKRKNINAMVGFDDVLIQIMDRLTGHPPNRQVLSIVGMGGIGKTTLARNVYDHQYIMNQFDIRIWVTISQEYRLRDILLQALSCCQNDEFNSSEDELGHRLYKNLCGRRYLIILDDVWSIEAWEELMLFFPDNKNGSRIMITTRLSNVSNYFGSRGFKMDFLDEDKSWKLLSKIVFEQDQCCCPPELEEIGKMIARNCKGLPLSIAVIGGLLANSVKTKQHWEYIAENLNPIVNLEDDMHCLKILYMSYNHLPIHLKPCFLYMGVFPEDSIIAVSRFKSLCVAEGFLKPIAAKSLEVVAEEYLKDLIDRNLILVHGLGASGKVKYCKIHDLLRDLCIREGKKDKFLWVNKGGDFENLLGIQSRRRSIHKSISHNMLHHGLMPEDLPSESLARSLISVTEDPSLLPLNFRLGRVFYMGSTSSYEIKNIFKFVNLRFLVFDPYSGSRFTVPSSIHLLWNLQILIINMFKVPPEIWEMSQLRHLESNDCFPLPDPPNVPLIHTGDDDYFILRNLHTLKSVNNFMLSEEVIMRIPNIKKLHVAYGFFTDEAYGVGRYGKPNFCLNNLGLLNKLESLVSKDMRMIGSLPHLEVLKLRKESFKGSDWNPVAGEFLCLKFLLIESCFDLVNWTAHHTHFPCLEKLVLRRLENLKEIPLDIGHISTLRSIELHDFIRDSVVMSAKNLLDEQIELGNEDLQVLVFEQTNTQLKSLATNNFQVGGVISR